VSTEATGQLPDTLDGIEVWTVRRQKQERKSSVGFLPPRRKKPCVMKSGVIQNDDDLFAGSAANSPKLFDECRKRDGIERIEGLRGYKLSVSNSDRAEITNRFSVRKMNHFGVFFFGRNPHLATRSVLIKMRFIQGPDIDV
jgi:hypothetical protein